MTSLVPPPEVRDRTLLGVKRQTISSAHIRQTMAVKQMKALN